MVVVKKDWIQAVKVPISSTLFGAGKTYRGFLVLIVLTSVFSVLFSAIDYPQTDWQPAVLGLLLGFAYALGELPNSYVKRKRGIRPGQKGSNRLLQLIFDKSDSLVFMLIPYALITNMSLQQVAVLFGLSFCIHITFSWLLWKLKLKRSL